MKLKRGDLLTNPAIEPRTRQVISVDDDGVWLKVTNKKDAVPGFVPFDVIDSWWRKTNRRIER